MMRVFAISDLHGYFPPFVPECELLLLGGDYAPTRDVEQQERFFQGRFTEFLQDVPAKYIVGIAGNHDFALENKEFAKSLPWTYLENEEVNIEGVRIYGTPYTPPFYNWAFMRSERELKNMAEYITKGLDILLSHGPAYRHLDTNADGINCGSFSLWERIKEVEPDSVVCGHIHEARGILQDGKTRFYNVAYLNGKYEPKYNCVSIPLRSE